MRWRAIQGRPRLSGRESSRDMATCGGGHESEATDFCDVCGMRMTGAGPAAAATPAPAPAPAPAAAAATPAAPASPATESGPSAAAAEHCPNCGAERTAKFCEACGFDFSSGTTAAGSGEAAGPAAAAGPVWTAVVTADRKYFDSVI